MNKLTPGLRLRSAVCGTEAIVVKPAAEGWPACGGAPMLAPGEDPPAGVAQASGDSPGTVVGKRYFDAVSGLEMLCVKQGGGPLSIDGRQLEVREAKQLPSSD
jgi:hypothetical protein